MKIIREGKDPLEVEHEAECRNCRTLFSFAVCEGEVYRDPRGIEFLSVACPKCGSYLAKRT